GDAPPAPGQGAAAAAGAASAPPVSVTTFAAQQRDWPVQISANGTVAALNTVEIHAQVASTVSKVAIREGQFVKAGELLFMLDSRGDEAGLAKAQAQLERSQATLADAQRQLARSRELFEQKFVSQSAVDANMTAVDGAQAAVSADRAAVAAAKVDLSYSRIVAPLAGRAGAINVYAGSYVQPSSPPLVTITQLDPIAVAFTLPQRDLPDVLAALKSGNAPVQATLPDGRGRLMGRLQFVDNAVDPNSGTVKVKAVFDNRDLLLWPGAFVAVQLSPRTLSGAIVVPQAAIVQGANANSVFVVGAEGKAAQRKVEVLASAGAEAVVSGIEPGARVVVEGKQNLRPGSTVRERAPDAAASGVGKERGGGKRGQGASAAGNGGAAVASGPAP
ncbi:MAG TPA: efflux RND transporter periplasmic adaptor subunit, partial [Burkholderiaceae bacterium]|nr:efflux RND transporter periplasmic adaptor subunit [Burkholderiaceae bacterium]